MKHIISKDSPAYVPFRRAGSQTKYSSMMCDKVVAVAMEGGFRAAMCVALNISLSTFNNYIRDYPDFADAVEFADLVTLAQQEQLLQDGARGMTEGKYNFTANAFILSNKYKHLYDKAGGGGNTEININNNTINLTPEQLTAKIAQKMEQLKIRGIELDPVVIEQIEGKTE